jgi:hypothetical protein
LECKYQNGSSAGPCQALTVQLPPIAKNFTMTDTCDGNRQGGGGSFGSKPDAVAVTITGSSHVATDTDLFHQRLNLPTISGSDQYTNNLYGYTSGGWLRTLMTHPCLQAEINLNDEVTDVGDYPADSIANGIYYWNQYTAFPTLVTRDRDAERWGNTCVVLAGAAAAFGIGFIPLAYERTGRLRRFRRRTRTAVKPEESKHK